MKSTIHLMFIIILSAVLFVSCDDSGAEDNPDGSTPVPVTLNNDFYGTLTLEYTRDFPSFSATVNINVSVYKSGDVVLSQPSSVTYDAMEVHDSGVVRIRDQGSITVTSLSGQAVAIGSDEYIQISKNTLITGEVTTWRWDDGLGWVEIDTSSYDYDNPADNPLNFILNDTMAGAVVGGTIAGVVTYKWTLVLMPI